MNACYCGAYVHTTMTHFGNSRGFASWGGFVLGSFEISLDRGSDYSERYISRLQTETLSFPFSFVSVGLQLENSTNVVAWRILEGIGRCKKKIVI